MTDRPHLAKNKYQDMPIKGVWDFAYDTIKENKSLAGFIVLTSLFQAYLIAYSATKIDDVYCCAEIKKPYDYLFEYVFLPALSAKCLDVFRNYLISKESIKKTQQLASTIANIHFSLPFHQRPTGSHLQAGRLIFECFDTIRPSTAMVYEKMIYSLSEITIFSWFISDGCDFSNCTAFNSSMILTFLSISGIYFHFFSKTVNEARYRYLSRYNDLYDYVSSTVNNYEAVLIFGAKEKLVSDISNRVREFSQTVHLVLRQKSFFPSLLTM